jgi:hypothetical protein
MIHQMEMSHFRRAQIPYSLRPPSPFDPLFNIRFSRCYPKLWSWRFPIPGLRLKFLFAQKQSLGLPIHFLFSFASLRLINHFRFRCVYLGSPFTFSLQKSSNPLFI